jgi:hypothetical protein
MPIFNINNKKNKLNNQYPSYLWHYRLDHINETRITKLNKEGYFFFYYESYKTCEAYLLSKMTKTTFIRKSERFNKLLGIIHTDVYGPMMIYVIGGYMYFITCTDNHIGYSYMYLIKIWTWNVKIIQNWSWNIS